MRTYPRMRRISPAGALIFMAATAALLLPPATPGLAGIAGPAVPPKVKTSTETGRRIPLRSTGGAAARAAQSTAIGFCGGDDWEPEIAADPGSAHVYVVWAHFPGNANCDPASGNPNRIYIRVSADGGKTFGPAHVVVDRISGRAYPRQVDCVVTVDPATGDVYVSFLAYGKKVGETDVAVARSTDHGSTFTAVKANGPLCLNCDHPWTLADQGNVYTAYAHGKHHFLARSADGGVTWTETDLLDHGATAFPEGGVLDAGGDAYFAWGDCLQAYCRGKVAADYQISRTKAGTSQTSFHHVASAPAGPNCPYSPSCGFAFFGVQNDIAIDSAGTLYMVWQDGQADQAGSPPIVQLSRSDDRGNHWNYVGRVDDKTASGCQNSRCYTLFPRVEGGGAGQIAAMWMDDRMGLPVNHTNGWNVWLRTSSTGGRSWTGPSMRVSTFDRTRPQSEPNGFRFPYGDYEGIDLLQTTSGTRAVMIWGEGINYTGAADNPGAVVYRRIAI